MLVSRAAVLVPLVGLFATVVACGGDDASSNATTVASSAGGTGGSGGADGTGASGSGDGGSGGVDCPGLSPIVASGALIPGSLVALSVPGASISPYLLSWTVSSGALSTPSGASTNWTLPADAAVDVAETLTVSVSAAADGCPLVTESLDLVVDFPPELRTAVVYNPSAVGSDEVAAYYAAFRGIPAGSLCAVASPDIELLDGASLPSFHQALMDCVDAVGPHVQTIVFVWGVPYKVSSIIGDIADPTNKVTTSLDALMAFGHDALSLKDAVYSPTYQAGDSMTGVFDPWVPFGELRKSIASDFYVVARIDGADDAAAKALVDRTAEAEALALSGALSGTAYVDGRYGTPHPATDDPGSYEAGEWNIAGVEEVFTQLGTYPVVADYNDAEFGTAPAPLLCTDALYYAGWYSFHNYNDAFEWAKGAIGGHLDSCSACDIRGDVDWSARALRKGITATFGAVNEPYVIGMPEYDQFFAYLTSGASFGEAAYESTLVGAWMMVWVGDPLYRPYPAAGR